jgi:hypothetical protein
VFVSDLTTLPPAAETANTLPPTAKTTSIERATSGQLIFDSCGMMMISSALPIVGTGPTADFNAESRRVVKKEGGNTHP